LNDFLLLVDRDGVINDLVPPLFQRGPRFRNELVLNQASLDVCELAARCGFAVAVVTNQPDYARGLLSDEDNEFIKKSVLDALPLGSTYFECKHDNAENCKCRKPKPGLIFQAIEVFGVRQDHVIFVGDKWTDVLAGKNAGVATALLENKNSWDSTSQGDVPVELTPTFTLKNTEDFAALIKVFPTVWPGLR
jgi:D-glycero-D-manno-heptose 1,7-bisphosphate phosphatase